MRAAFKHKPYFTNGVPKHSEDCWINIIKQAVDYNIADC